MTTNQTLSDCPGSLEQDYVENYVAGVNWNKRLQKEIPFITNIFSKNNYQHIIDLGCGPGFHAKAIAENNFHVTGLDVNEAMIKYAKKINVNTNVKYVLGNFLEDDKLFSRLGSTDAIYSLGNAFMIIWSLENVILENILQKISNALTSNGGFFFQILNSDCPRNGFVVSDIAHNEEAHENKILIKHFLPQGDHLHTAFMTIKWKDGQKKIVKEENNSGSLLLVSYSSLQKLLHNVGFKRLSFWADYDGNPFIPSESDALLCLAQK